MREDDMDYPASRSWAELDDPDLPHLVTARERQARKDAQVVEQLFLGMQEKVEPEFRGASIRPAGPIQAQTRVVFVPVPTPTKKKKEISASQAR